MALTLKGGVVGGAQGQRQGLAGLGGDGAWLVGLFGRSGKPARGVCGQYSIDWAVLGTLMRHRLGFAGLAGAPALCARGVVKAPGSAALIALPSFLLRSTPTDGRAGTCAVALATIAVAAHQHRRATQGTQKTSGNGLLHAHHRHTQAGAVLDEMPCRCNTGAAPVTDTV